MNLAIFILIAGIIAMVIGALNSGRRGPDTPANYDTTNISNTSDFVFFDSDVTHHCHHHGHVDHNFCSDISHGGSGSFDSGGCDSGGGGCD